MKSLGYLPGNLLDAAHRLHIELLRGELDCGVARMDTGKLDMLRDGVKFDFSVLRHCVHLNLLGLLNELADHHRVFLRHVGRQTEEARKLLLVGADIHGGARKHVGGTHKNWESYLGHELVDGFERRKLTPARLVYPD